MLSNKLRLLFSLHKVLCKYTCPFNDRIYIIITSRTQIEYYIFLNKNGCL